MGTLVEKFFSYGEVDLPIIAANGTYSFRGLNFNPDHVIVDVWVQWYSTNLKYFLSVTDTYASGIGSKYFWDKGSTTDNLSIEYIGVSTASSEFSATATMRERYSTSAGSRAVSNGFDIKIPTGTSNTSSKLKYYAWKN